MMIHPFDPRSLCPLDGVTADAECTAQLWVQEFTRPDDVRLQILACK